MSAISFQDVIRVLKLIDDAGDADMALTIGDMSIKVTRRAAAPESAAAPRKNEATSRAAEPEATAETEAATAAASTTEPAGAAPRASEDAATVVAPMGGVFYAAPAPGKPPFARVGQAVKTGDQLGIVEVMKLFTPVTAACDGVVSAIYVEDQSHVAKDELLMAIDAASAPS